MALRGVPKPPHVGRGDREPRDVYRRLTALGARLTGAGFGGCAVALVARTETDALEVSARRGFEDEDFEEPEFYEFRPAAGAEAAG